MMKSILRSTIAGALALSCAFPAFAATETTPKKEPSAAQMAARERMTKCRGEWKDAKAGGKVEAGIEMAEILEPVQRPHESAEGLIKAGL